MGIVPASKSLECTKSSQPVISPKEVESVPPSDLPNHTPKEVEIKLLFELVSVTLTDVVECKA